MAGTPSAIIIRKRLRRFALCVAYCAGLALPVGARADTVPNDPNYLTLSQRYLRQVNLEQAWDTETGSHEVVVAVLDTGVNYLHPDLLGNIWSNADEIPDNGIDDDNNGYIDDTRGWDFVHVDPANLMAGEDGAPADNDPMDFGGHGTMVAGVIGAMGNNAAGATGVSWGVSIMPLRVGYVVSNGQSYVCEVPEALHYACDNGADIVNMSVADTMPSQNIKEAVDYCVDKGVLLVAGAGNWGTTKPSYPAAFEGVVAVANTFGTYKYDSSNYGIWTDIAAPGVSLYTTKVDGTYTEGTGTSMSTPMVSGVAALLKAANPTYTAADLRRHLLATATSLRSEQSTLRMGLGAGLLQADLAVTTANLPERAEVVSLSMENNTHPAEEGFREGDTITIRPTVRNLSTANDQDLTVTLSLPESGSALTPIDTTVSLPGVKLDEKQTSWNDTLQVRVGEVLAAYHQETFTLTVSNGQGVLSREDFTLPLNPRLGQQALLADASLAGGFERPQLAVHPDGGISAVFESSLFASPNKQLYHCTRGVNGSWGPIVALPNSAGLRQNRAALAVGGDGRLHLAFGQYEPLSGTGGIYYNTYDPATSSWGQPTELAATPSYKVLKSRINLSLDPNGNPMVIWSDWRNGTEGDIRLVRHDGSAWLPEEMVADLTVVQDPSQNGDFQQVACFSDSGGAPLAIWVQNDGVYYARKVAGAWQPPTLLATDQDFSAAVDSQGGIHLVSVTTDDPANATANYRRFDGSSWGPVASPIGSYDRNKTKVRINAIGQPEIFTLQYQSGKTGLYHTAYDGQNWSTMDLVYPNESPGALYFSASDVVLTAGSEILFALGDEDRFSQEHTPIVVLSSAADPGLLPSQPQVTLRGGEDPNQMILEFSSTHAAGIAGYFIALGSAPGQDDLSTWFERSLVAGNQYLLPLAALPWREGQTYYASVRALGNNGYLSAVGASHGLPSVGVFSGPANIEVGNSATLTWHTSNATTVTIAPGVGTVATDGSVVLTPTATTTYTLTATGEEATVSETFTVEVVEPPPPPPGATTLRFDDGGDFHTCTVSDDDTVRCWGKNNDDQLGDGSYVDKSIPTAAWGISNAPTPIVQVVGGAYHSCALFADGTVKCWGRGSNGQLGNGSTYGSTPVSVVGLDNAVQIAAGQLHTCAVLDNGGVKCWGYNGYGQLGIGSTTMQTVPTLVNNITNAVQVALGDNYSCALLSDGTIKCWGANHNGQLGLGYYSYNNYTSPNLPVTTITNSTQITAGATHACATLADKTARCWGANHKGQLGNGVLYNPGGWAPTAVVNSDGAATLGDIDQISAGYHHTCALQTGGAVSCWGSNSYSELGAGGSGSYSTRPVAISGVNGASSLVIGGYHNCAFTPGSADGMSCWGRGGNGQLGNGATANSAVPVEPLF